MNKNEIFALTLIRNVGQSTVANIVNFMIENNLESVQQIDTEQLISKIRHSKAKEALHESLREEVFQQYLHKAENILDAIEAKGIEIVSIFDERYPQLLKTIKSAPIFLYCKGNLSLLSKTKNVAVVGTRDNTSLGGLIAEKTVSFLCDNNYTIVSGLALGIDTLAHEQTLKKQGKAIAVLVDVDNVQPARNRGLAERILLNDGLLIAEEIPGIKIIPSMFAKRDRIQSGLSLAVFPIETSKDGGTMHAVKNAKNENRLIYVPDIEKSGYANTRIKQLEGISYLAKEKIAIPYTKNYYNDMLRQLHDKEEELCKEPLKKKNIGLFG